MFNENLKALRKQKGYTQETLAIKLNVVRQTISKWEKGLSVPDVDMLEKIAEELETSVSQLLGSDPIEGVNEKSTTAEQLATIAEQLAAGNRRKRKIWKIVKVIIIVNILIILIAGVVGFLGLAGYINIHGSDEGAHHQYVCRLDGNEYTCDVIYDEDNGKIIEIHGDYDAPFDFDKYEDVKTLDDEIHSYYKSNGGTVEDISF